MSYVNIQERNSPFLLRYLADVVTYRHLMWNLVASDLRSRFRRSYFGVLWAILQPLAFSLIVGYVWGRLFKYESVWDYALYVFSGMIVWEYFSAVINLSQEALPNAQGYLKQTRIPFFVFQIRTALTGLVILLFGMIGLVAMMAVMGRLPALGVHLLLIPLYFPIVFMFMAPLAIAMSILGTQLRDLKYITLLAVQALFFVSPVMLGREVFASEGMHWINLMNPMYPLLMMFREPLFESAVWTYEQVSGVAAWTAAFWTVAIILAASNGRRLVFSL